MSVSFTVKEESGRYALNAFQAHLFTRQVKDHVATVSGGQFPFLTAIMLQYDRRARHGWWGKRFASLCVGTVRSSEESRL